LIPIKYFAGIHDRNPMAIMSGLDTKAIYHPPLTLQLPGGKDVPVNEPEGRGGSSPPSTSSSRSDLSSPSFNRDSELEFASRSKEVEEDGAKNENPSPEESDSNSTTATPKTVVSSVVQFI
jgi:hypothetical protein